MCADSDPDSDSDEKGVVRQMNHLEWTTTLPGVFYTTTPVVTVYRELIDQLKTEARRNDQAKARLCLHRDADEKIQQMIIAHRRGNYVRPHCHATEIESFLVIEGRMIVFLFDDRGALVQKIDMGPIHDGEIFYCRIEKGRWHTAAPVTEEVVFLETTEGPFDAVRHSIYAEWAPAPKDEPAASAYIENLIGRRII